MNNPHQALIEEKVAEFDKCFDRAAYKRNGWSSIPLGDIHKAKEMFTQILQATINTVLEEERERASEYMTPEGGAAYLKALTPLPDKE